LIYFNIVVAQVQNYSIRFHFHRYKSRDDFLTDVRLVFDNCEIFNEDDSPVGKAGHNLRTFFESRWADITGLSPGSACSGPASNGPPACE
jgi:hypothetical protein